MMKNTFLTFSNLRRYPKMRGNFKLGKPNAILYIQTTKPTKI